MAHQIQIQDGFLFGCLKDRTVLGFQLLNSKTIKGVIVRFDRYCIVVELNDGQAAGGEFMLYKHALAGILAPNGAPNQQGRDRNDRRSAPPRRNTHRPAYA